MSQSQLFIGQVRAVIPVGCATIDVAPASLSELGDIMVSGGLGGASCSIAGVVLWTSGETTSAGRVDPIVCRCPMVDESGSGSVGRCAGCRERTPETRWRWWI